jgi:hypothetical protein
MAKTTTKPTVRFTARAYQQMWALVDACDIEISAWGFCATEAEKKKDGVFDDFYITEFRPVDQECSGGYTEMDADASAEQLMELKEEGVDNPGLRRCVHMHSHVNMDVGQSSIDENWIEKIAKSELLGDVGIFIIANKKRALNVRVEMYKPFRQTFEKCTHRVDQIDILPDGWGKDMVEKHVREAVRQIETLATVKRAQKTNIWSYGGGQSGYSHHPRPIVSAGNRVLHGNTWMWEQGEEEEEPAAEEEAGFYIDPLEFPKELSELQSFYDEGGLDANEAMHLYAKWAAKEISTEEVVQELEEVHNYPGENPVDTVENLEQDDDLETDDERIQKTA